MKKILLHSLNRARNDVHSEACSTPPTTPLDELALKRHRFFADLIDAAHAAIDHRVRFDPLASEVLSDERNCRETPINSKSDINVDACHENP